jgi:hypothetical protein
LFVVA